VHAQTQTHINNKHVRLEKKGERFKSFQFLVISNVGVVLKANMINIGWKNRLINIPLLYHSVIINKSS
jgi:hypothetical protein